MNKLPLTPLFFLLLGWGLIWFKDLSSASINPDEVVWTLDARFYDFRRQKNWSKFQVNRDSLNSDWASDQYRLLDQPQSGKYFYGWLIHLFQLDPWDDEYITSLYTDFAQSELNLGSLKELGSKKYQDLAAAIYLLRIVGAAVGYLGVVMLAGLVYLMTNRRLTSGVLGTLLLLHPTLFHWYRLAVPNNLQITLLIITAGLMLLLHSSSDKLNMAQLGKWWGLGLILALAASIKLNAFFWLAAPIFIWLGDTIRLGLTSQEMFSFGLKVAASKTLLAYLFLTLGFALGFYFLEPELWAQPWQGLNTLFAVRLMQHRRFLIYFTHYSFGESIVFLWQEFLRISDLFFIKVGLTLFAIQGIKVIVRRFYSRRWSMLAGLLLFLILANAYYANVGFSRYAEWSIFVFSLLVALGITETLRQLHTFPLQVTNHQPHHLINEKNP